jgi:hypothetical protein
VCCVTTWSYWRFSPDRTTVHRTTGNFIFKILEVWKGCLSVSFSFSFWVWVQKNVDFVAKNQVHLDPDLFLEVVFSTPSTLYSM